MDALPTELSRRWLERGSPLRTYALIGAMVLLVTLLHYNTAMHIHAAHGIYRRLYYFPIILAAFRGGWPAGLATAVIVCAVYIPHAFGFIGFDPAPTLEKILEMILYVAVGLVSGVLVSRETRIRRRLETTAASLRAALDEKTAMETELIRSARLAAVGKLSAGLAHEIRNPLASIKASAQVIADDFPQDSPKGRLLQILGAETGRLNDVLTRFLKFARPSTARRALFDLAEEAGAALELLGQRKNAPETSLRVTPETDLHLNGDAQQIRQLLLNLLLNAAAAAGPRGRVELTITADDNQLAFTVADDGPGFTDESLEHFGTPFYSTREDGTGLGLAICQRIVDDHGGTIAVVSPVGHGASIRVTLPRERGG